MDMGKAQNKKHIVGLLTGLKLGSFIVKPKFTSQGGFNRFHSGETSSQAANLLEK
jgi:hypothetical protein